MNPGKFILYHTKQIKKGLVYVYYMIAWYYRKNKKPIRETLKHLGKLTSQEVEHYQQSIACLNQDPQYVSCYLPQVFVRESKDYLPYAVGLYLWDFWRLSAVFQEDLSRSKEITTGEMAQVLTLMRPVEACSKSLTAKIFSHTCLPELLDLSPQRYNKTRVFRELEQIEQHREALGKHIFEIAKEKQLTQGEILFYDLSSGNFTGLRCLLSKWGHCKDGYLMHVVLLLVITPEGYPIYWEVLEGNTADAKTLADLVQKMERLFGKIESVLCFDRGMVSDENLDLLEGKEIRFITALDGNQVQYFKSHIPFSQIKKIKEWDLEEQFEQIQKELELAGFVEEKENLFYQEILLSDDQKEKIEELTDKLNLKERRYFLAFNPEMAFLAQKHRQERVIEFLEWIHQYNQELSQAIGSRKKETVKKAIQNELRKRNIANVDLSYTLSPYPFENKNEEGKIKKGTTYKILMDPMTPTSYSKARQYDGIWVLITNWPKKKDADFFKKTQWRSFFQIYRFKNIIEEAFRILSDFVEVEPFYVYKKEHVQAHFTLCVLSYLLDITLLNQIRQSKDLENRDLHHLFGALKKCKKDTIQLNLKTSISKITQTTPLQEKILKILNCSHLISPEYLIQNKIISPEGVAHHSKKYKVYKF